jgi:hypothetical protein
MRTSRLTSILFAVAALMSSGAGFAVARDGPATDFSLILEWKNQIISDLEHNKRYLPGNRIRGKLGVVRYELKVNRAGWVLPGTRIVTLDDDLGRVALLLLQQSQPFPPPENVNLPDGSFRIEVPIRFVPMPPQEATGSEELDRRKLVECYEADRQEMEYQRRKAARRKIEPPNGVFRMPEGCVEAKRREADRLRSTAQASE